MRVVVTGASGQLGAAVVEDFRTAHDTVPLTRRDADLTDDAAVAAAVDRVGPEVIVNCAAYNDVDGAEDHPIEALNANAFAVRALARAAERLGATLVHYSTDFVFDGTAVRPYSEEDRPNPRSVYATSKLLGDWFAFDAPRAYVLRVESLFGRAPNGPEPRGSVASILSRLMAGESPKVFIDRTISPTYVVDAARATRELVERAAPAGLYHCVNSGACTWFEFARELAHRLGLEAALTPVRTNHVALRAARPLYCALSNEKLRRVGIEMPAWQDAVRRFVST
ncbi:MAG: dTDP-4-dehydrorhamnose reductase [Acidobacteria bacterium]|nr:MAG: dTDP-4-dehydrorhamnose reductase [Acidobacteriota bacterium]PYQ84980.1 MAG: dTDP-4-dehydrorhamnose reductase [Acidobacteriota bacterium]PYQ90327.1 MAG: dTDP-4-dehydrorhamnose reductase [Acidobacteriota bacterium]PYR09190.1 MAG: dTDP-4-dehydrorhamnose reductase [Acidobacteriota bacterium]